MLRGKNTLIRPMTEGDLDLVYKWVTEQKHFGEFMGTRMMYKDQYIEAMKKKFKNPNSFFGIIENNEQTPIAMINYREVPGSHTSVELGLVIAEEEARGKGVGKEVLELFVDYIFRSKPIYRIELKTRTDNEAARKLSENFGFTVEGILRGFRFDQGKMRDYYIVSMLREDWEKFNKDNIA